MDEATALEQVVQGLEARFSSVDAATIRSVVDEVHRTFDGPVRDYVPLLVERASRERLFALVAEPGDLTAAPPSDPQADPTAGAPASPTAPPVAHGRWNAVSV